MAQFFCHNEHILVDGRKMAKSAGNFYTLEDIIKKGYDPLAFRLLVLQAHYRSQVNFSWENLDAAQNRLRSLRAFADLRFQPITSGNYEIEELDYIEYGKIIARSMQDDLSSPKAMETLARLVDLRTNSIILDEVNEFKDFVDLVDRLFGLQLLSSNDITAEQKQLIAGRERAREGKDWAKADQLRGQLQAQGVGVRDTPQGPIWYRTKA
jgi:cysteinyl-tRNA synthetase